MQPDMQAGDLLLIVQEIQHESFVRKGADLFFKKSISIVEALLGFTFSLKHLDGRQFTIRTNPG